MKRKIFNLRNVATAIACLAATVMFSGCDPEDDPIDPGTEQEANIVAFTFEGIDGTAAIDKTARTVTARANETADLTAIKAEFTLSLNATATVGGTTQVSGQTVNSFTSPVTYSVTSGDGETTLDWTVTITGGKTGTDPSGVWTRADFSLGEPGGWRFNAVAYGNGKFVAVAESNVNGYFGAIAYSADGINWTKVENHPFENYISSVTYGDGKFVAVGHQGRLAYSADGISWTEANSTFGNTMILDVIYADSKFVAVGGGGKRAYSTDGITWTAATDTHFDDYSAYCIAYGGGRFLTGGTTNLLSYSTDGATWHGLGVPFSSSSYTWILSAAYGGGKFVLGGDVSGKLAYSTNNGDTWTELSEKPFGNTNINALMYDGNKFIAGTLGGRIGYSTDGITWSVLNMNETSFVSGSTPIAIYGIIYDGNGTYVAVGQGCIAYLKENN